MTTDLWLFAQELYQQPGVEAACLRLQAYGADVCLLLCAAWLERRQIDCNATRAEALRQFAQPWQQQVVVPLRQLRQSWRERAAGDDALALLREQVKQLELVAERQQLQRLAQCSEAWPRADATTSAQWLDALAPEPANRNALQTLRIAATQLNA